MATSISTGPNSHVYLWEIIFVLLISGTFVLSYFGLGDIDFALIWDTIFPYVVGINAAGLIVSLFMYLILKSTEAKIKIIDDAGKKKINDLFLWVNDKPKTNPKWERIERLSSTNNQSDWRVAILEADSMLDDLIEKLGYDGANMGERLLNMNSNNFPYLESAWKVHKLRNIVAHETSYDLQKSEVEDAIDIYNLIFKSANFI